MRMVHCIKLGKELPGLVRVPFKGELGQRVFDQVSNEAYKMWLEHGKMIINEYRLNMATAESQSLLLHELEKYFFGGGSEAPKEFVPPSAAPTEN
jgi:Fe-S cluster biosynthesis and repair protein YggX